MSGQPLAPPVVVAAVPLLLALLRLLRGTAPPSDGPWDGPDDPSGLSPRDGGEGASPVALMSLSKGTARFSVDNLMAFGGRTERSRASSRASRAGRSRSSSLGWDAKHLLPTEGCAQHSASGAKDDAYSKIVQMHGDHPMQYGEWKDFCQRVSVDFSEPELKRIFDHYDRDGDGALESGELRRALDRSIFLKNVCSRIGTPPFDLDPQYDYTRSTEAAYGVPDRTFFGQFPDIRERLDYSYHVNYTEARQLWQDDLVNSVVCRTVPQPLPWVVFTCGAMGAGKGHVMAWMSAENIFPLENIVQIDPDVFKRNMPEWPGYVRRDPLTAGTLCHRESGFIQEIATEVALRTSQHVWVDGSLRDGDWFVGVFDDIRTRYPDYRIAIFSVHASERVVRARCDSRARETGRAIPEHALVGSLQGPALSLNKLIPKCDLVARIDNDDVPVLSALELVDRSGNWAPIRDQFAHVLPSPYEFPESMAPLFLLRTDFGAAHLRLRRGCAGATCGGDLLPPAWALLGPTCAALRLGDAGPLVFSGTRPLNISYDARAKAQIPTCAQTYAFSYALPQACEAEGLDRENPHVCFLANGGYVYFDHRDVLVHALAITPKKSRKMVQFGPAQAVRRSALCHEEIRWQRVPQKLLRSKGAQMYTWVTAGEVFAGQTSRHGGFAYALEGGDVVLFPVAGAQALDV